MIVLIVKYRNQSALLRLHEEIEELRAIKDKMQSANTCLVSSKDYSIYPENQNIDERTALIERKVGELLTIINTSKKIEVKPIALSPELKEKINGFIKNKKHIPHNDSTWDEIEACILSVSPNFRTDLWLMSNDMITEKEYRTAQLIKCGVSPTDMKTLLCVEKGSIYSRRESLSKKIFGEKKSITYIDHLIRIL